MGRTAEPTSLKLLKGNPGKRAINKREPAPKGKAVAPATLTPDAKPIWTRIVGSMPSKVYATTDESLLAAYCEAVAMFRKAATEVQRNGLTTIGSTGQVTISPYVRIQSDQARLLVTLGARLGLDPVARAAIDSGDEAVADDPFRGLIG